ncbi:hypothetical protein ACS0TY_023181 [Phlomoides rotata]
MSFILFKLPKNLEFQFNFSVFGYGQKGRIILITQPAIDTPGGSTNLFLDMGKKTKPYLSPNRPSTPQEEAQTDLRPLPPPEKSKEDILLFFKLYDPEKKELRFVGRLFVKSSVKPIDILSKLNEMAGFAPDEEIELFEIEDGLQLNALSKSVSLMYLQF